MSTCLVVQHVAPESAFTISDALVAAGVRLDTRRVFAGDPVPSDAASLDGLVVMGGPMSATSDAGFTSRRTEIELLADAIALGIPTLGICLGAQLLAAAAGASVVAGGSGPEIGWGAIELLEACDDDALFVGLPEHLTVLHWHSDTFALPVGAHHLVANANYPSQAFRIGDCAWGLQFHLEVTETAVSGFLDAFPSDAALASGGAAGLRDATASALASLRRSRDLLVERFASLVASRVTTGDLIDLG